MHDYTMISLPGPWGTIFDPAGDVIFSRIEVKNLNVSQPGINSCTPEYNVGPLIHKSKSCFDTET